MNLHLDTHEAEENAVVEPPQVDVFRASWQRHRFRLAPALVACLAVFVVHAGRDLEVKSLQDPGPGMWPLIVAVVMGVTGALLILRDIPEDYERWNRQSVRVLAAIVMLAAFVWLFPTLGFLVSAVLILFLWMKVLGRESWRLSLVLSTAGALVLNYIFVDLFSVPFPPGLIVITTGG